MTIATGSFARPRGSTSILAVGVVMEVRQIEQNDEQVEIAVLRTANDDIIEVAVTHLQEEPCPFWIAGKCLGMHGVRYTIIVRMNDDVRFDVVRQLPTGKDEMVMPGLRSLSVAKIYAFNHLKMMSRRFGQIEGHTDFGVVKR